MFDQADILFLLSLLAAHLVADFLLQPVAWIESKRDEGILSVELYLHSLVVGAVTFIFLWDLSLYQVPLIIMITHYLIDLWKSTHPDNAKAFLTDQAAHILVIGSCWIVYADLWGEFSQYLGSLIASPSIWIVLISYLIIIWPMGYLIAQITHRWQDELSGNSDQQLTGLQHAGMWIGRSERFIILTFILLNQYSAIGFLIAAKSIFRFSGTLKGDQARKEAEYILIGTLLSFAFAIVVGITVVYLIDQL